MRKTQATIKVAIALLAEPDAQHYGYRLSKSSGVRAGTLYPMLTQMLDEGWLIDGWEQDPPQGRPARRFYELTENGRARLGGLLAMARTERRFAGLDWRPVSG